MDLKAMEREISDGQNYLAAIEQDLQRMEEIEGIQTQDIAEKTKKLRDDWIGYLDWRQVSNLELLLICEKGGNVNETSCAN